MNDMGKTMVLGIGNGGCNIIEMMRRVTKQPYLKEAHYVFADCDIQDLDKHRHEAECSYILLDDQSDNFPSEIFKDVENLMIVAGLTGFTGSKYSICAIELAHTIGVKAIRFVGITGFLFESKRIRVAIETFQAIIKMPYVSWMRINNENFPTEYMDRGHGEKKVSAAFLKWNSKIVKCIDSAITMNRKVWNEYTIVGDNVDLDYFLECVERGRINRYDVLQTMTRIGLNYIGNAECKEFHEDFQKALRNIPIKRVEKLLICCGERVLSVSNFRDLYNLSIGTDHEKFEVKLVKIKDENFTDALRIVVVASWAVSPSKDPGFGIFQISEKI